MTGYEYINPFFTYAARLGINYHRIEIVKFQEMNLYPAFGEKVFVTVVIPGSGHRCYSRKWASNCHATYCMPHTAFRAIVTVVAALFQEQL